MAPADGTPDAMRLLLMTFSEQVRPFHEWLAGQRAHFTQQGYSDDEARAMAAALFVTMFGAHITRTPDEPEPGDSP